MMESRSQSSSDADNYYFYDDDEEEDDFDSSFSLADLVLQQQQEQQQQQENVNPSSKLNNISNDDKDHDSANTTATQKNSIATLHHRNLLHKRSDSLQSTNTQDDNDTVITQATNYTADGETDNDHTLNDTENDSDGTEFSIPPTPTTPWSRRSCRTEP